MIRTPSVVSPLEWDCPATISGSVEHRFGVTECSAGADRYRCTVTLGDWAAGPDGDPRWGVLATPMDHLMGQAIHDQRPPRRATVTTEMTVDFHRRFAPGQRLAVYAEVSAVDRLGGHALGWIRDEDDNLIATGRSWLSFVPAREEPPVERPNHAAHKQSTLIEGLLGVRHQGSGSVVISTMSTPQAWANEMGFVHGGVWGCLSEMSASTLVGQAAEPMLRPAGMTVVYLRAGTATAPTVLTAGYERRGRRSAVVEVVGRSGGPDACIRSTVTFRPRDEAPESP